MRFVPGWMAQKAPLIVAELGVDTDPFLLHLYAIFAQKEREMISKRTKAALHAAKARGVVLEKHAPASRKAGMKRSKALEDIVRAKQAKVTIVASLQPN